MKLNRSTLAKLNAFVKTETLAFRGILEHTADWKLTSYNQKKKSLPKLAMSEPLFPHLLWYSLTAAAAIFPVTV